MTTSRGSTFNRRKGVPFQPSLTNAHVSVGVSGVDGPVARGAAGTSTEDLGAGRERAAAPVRAGTARRSDPQSRRETCSRTDGTAVEAPKDDHLIGSMGRVGACGDKRRDGVILRAAAEERPGLPPLRTREQLRLAIVALDREDLPPPPQATRPRQAHPDRVREH
jgi:hypothetical protein